MQDFNYIVYKNFAYILVDIVQCNGETDLIATSILEIF